MKNVDADLFPSVFVTRVSECVQAYQEDPTDGNILASLRSLRGRVAGYWIHADCNSLERLYAGEAGDAHRILCGSGMQVEPLTPEEEREYAVLSENIILHDEQVNGIQSLIAAMLYRPADMLPEQILRIAIPAWLWRGLVPFLLRARNFFVEPGEVERYRRYLERVVEYFHAHVMHDGQAGSPGNGREIALQFAQYANFIPVYFDRCDMKNLMVMRAEILESVLRREGCPIEYTPARANHDRIRIGILNAHFKPQTETYATLPVFEYLDREKYEVILFSTEIGGHALEQYCASRADRLVGLPAGLGNQMRTVRDADLDVLFFGSNLTAVSSAVSMLANSRMAPVQVTSICSPVTTGMKTMDYYFAGDLTVSADADRQHYTERLMTMPGSGLCFSFVAENTRSEINPGRRQMGIPDDTVVYVSGANFFKLTPEVRETWARIIAAVPDSLLVLYPFNPYWSRSYQVRELMTRMHALFDRYGIDSRRLVLLKPFPNRADILQILKLCDVYLDSYPYGGATSIVDPLQAGLPPVVLRGEQLRFRQAAAMLTELDMPALVATDEAGYRSLAISLGRDHDLRRGLRNEIIDKMTDVPAFLDSKRFAMRIGDLFAKLMARSARGIASVRDKTD